MANNNVSDFSSASETYSNAESLFAELPAAFENMMVKLHYFSQFNQYFGKNLAILTNVLAVPNAIFAYSQFGLRIKDEALLNRKQFCLLQTKSKLQQIKAKLTENPGETQLSDEITALDAQLKQLYAECITLEQKLTDHDKDTLVSNFGLATHQTTRRLMELDGRNQIQILKIASSHFLNKSLLLCEQILDKIVWPSAGVILNVLELVFKHIVPVLTIINESKSLLQDGKSLLISLGHLYKAAKQKQTDNSQEATINLIKTANQAIFDGLQYTLRVAKIGVAIAGTVLLLHPATAPTGVIMNAVAGVLFTGLSLGITAARKAVTAQINRYATENEHVSSKAEPAKMASFYSGIFSFFGTKDASKRVACANQNDASNAAMPSTFGLKTFAG